MSKCSAVLSMKIEMKSGEICQAQFSREEHYMDPDGVEFSLDDFREAEGQTGEELFREASEWMVYNFENDEYYDDMEGTMMKWAKDKKAAKKIGDRPDMKGVKKINVQSGRYYDWGEFEDEDEIVF